MAIDNKKIQMKKRECAKQELIRTARQGQITRLNTMMKDLYGMLLGSFMNANMKNPEIQKCAHIISDKYINCSRRPITKQKFTWEQVQEQIVNIHSFGQKMVRKNVIVLNKLSNIMQGINLIYRTVQRNVGEKA